MANNVSERSSARYTATLVDEAGVVVPLAALTSLTFWLRDVSSNSYINNRDAQNGLNANNVTYHASSGLLTWLLQPADNTIVGDEDTEEHEAVFQVIWDTSTKAKTWKVAIQVSNLVPIT